MPAKVAGEWKVTLPNGDQGTLSLTQKFQKVDGVLKTKGTSTPVKDARLKGPTLTFRYGEGSNTSTATAQIEGKRLTGTLKTGSSSEPAQLTGELSQ